MNIDIDNFLVGSDAFYNKKDYVSDNEFHCDELSKDVVVIDTKKDNCSSTINKIFKIVFFPIGLYQLFHSIIGMFIFHSYFRDNTKDEWNLLSNMFAEPRDFLKDLEKSGLKFKRITLDTGNSKIDTAILGSKKSFRDRKKPWIIISNGNGMRFYDHFYKNSPILEMVKKLDAKALFFDYPSVGLSSGYPNRKTMVKTYRKILKFLDEKINAQKIIGYGFSIGGGVQGEAIEDYPFKANKKYLFIKDRTFSDLSKAAYGLKIPFLLKPFFSIFIILSGWNISSKKSSLKLKHPEIILQKVKMPNFQNIQKTLSFDHDGIISKDASLGQFLLENHSLNHSKKRILGIMNGHNNPLTNVSKLTRIVNEALA